MRILLIHNYYQQRGGEDECFEQEAAHLRRYGHEVRLYSRHNDELKGAPAARRALVPLEAVWSMRTGREITRAVREFRPDVAHVHNFFPLISPSVFRTCRALGVPTVHTLHHYRLLCPGAWFFRSGSVCEECLQHSLLRGVRHRCYHGSAIDTAAVAAMLLVHSALRTWTRHVSAFVVPGNFARSKFIEAGWRPEKIHVRPNFQEPPAAPAPAKREGLVFVGRLSPEKGLPVLLAAWKQLPDIPLTIAGDGPLGPWVRDYVAKEGLQNVRVLGFRPQAEVLGEIQKAAGLVVTSLWYEVCIRVIIEAYASGTPVLASRIGSLAEMVEDGRTGLLFSPGDPDDLARQARAFVSSPSQTAAWGEEARATFNSRYSPDAAHEGILAVYRSLVAP
jgi:glycosyltransferase involved in cell wall biosynthesis